MSCRTNPPSSLSLLAWNSSLLGKDILIFQRFAAMGSFLWSCLAYLKEFMCTQPLSEVSSGSFLPNYMSPGSFSKIISTIIKGPCLCHRITLNPSRSCHGLPKGPTPIQATFACVILVWEKIGNSFLQCPGRRSWSLLQAKQRGWDGSFLQATFFFKILYLLFWFNEDRHFNQRLVIYCCKLLFWFIIFADN